MIFIFGFGHQTESDRGINEEMFCPGCNKNTQTSFRIIRKWITFFFLPVIPYSKKEYRVCKNCGYSVESGKK